MVAKPERKVGTDHKSQAAEVNPRERSGILAMVCGLTGVACLGRQLQGSSFYIYL